jgi:hypothetical protein
MLKEPFAPATSLCTIKAASLSTSRMLSVPLALNATSVSVNTTLAEPRTAASLLPLMVTCTVVVVPSALATVKLSLTLWPSLRLLKALFAT